MYYYETDYGPVYEVPIRLLRKFLRYTKEQGEHITRIERPSKEDKKYAVRVISCTDNTIMCDF